MFLILEGIRTVTFSVASSCLFYYITLAHSIFPRNKSTFYDGDSKSFCRSSTLISVWCRFWFFLWLSLIIVKDSAFSAFYLSSAIPTQQPAIQMRRGVPSINIFFFHKFIFTIDNWYFIWKVLNRLPFINDKAISRFVSREVEGLQVFLAYLVILVSNSCHGPLFNV